MHRFLQQFLAHCENLFQQMEWEKAYKDHRKRVANAKAVVDCCPPMIYSHVQLNIRKLKNEAERLRLIEKENRLMLERIARIMKTEDACSVLTNNSQNRNKRKRELCLMDRLSRAMHERLINCLPWYYLQRWCEDCIREEALRGAIIEIPQICCCYRNVVYETKSKKRAPRRKPQKLKQEKLEYKVTKVADEKKAKNIKHKKDSYMNMEEFKSLEPKIEEVVMSSKSIKEENRDFRLKNERLEELESRLMAEMKSRMSKLEEELNKECKMLQDIRTMIRTKEEEESNHSMRKEAKSRDMTLQEVENIESQLMKEIEERKIRLKKAEKELEEEGLIIHAIDHEPDNTVLSGKSSKIQEEQRHHSNVP